MTCGRRPLRTGVPMATIRAQVVLQAFTNKVEDRYINTFHFVNQDSFSVHAGNIHTGLTAFYNGTASGGSTGPSANIASFVNRLASINYYDMSTPEPRIPLTVPLTLNTAVNTTGLPQELAVCLSFRGQLPISPRRRGRIYFGPLSNHGDNIASGTSSIFPFVGTIIRQRLVEHAKDLRNTGLGWSIRSSVPFDNYVLVDQGYVDDAFDIQRRRGHETTVRTLFSNTLP